MANAIHAVPLTKSSFAASSSKRTPDKGVAAAPRDIDAFAKHIVESRDILPWSDFVRNVHRSGYNFLGLPVEYRKIVEEANPTFRLVSLSAEESAAKFQEMRALFNELSDEYHAGGDVAAALYSMVRMIILAIIAAQSTMIRQARGVAEPALQFVDIIDDDGRMRTDRMLPPVICPNNFR